MSADAERPSTTPKFSIIAPPGAFGNHLRWLLLLDSRFSFPDNATNKVEFIEHCVYPNNRTWHNWLGYEWKYRRQLDQQIYLDHANEHGVEFLQKSVPTLLCSVSALLGIRCYVKWRSDANVEALYHAYINNWSPKAFKNIVKDNQAESWTKLTNVDVLFSSELDKNFYQSIITFFDLEDHYASAQRIHSRWYDRQIKAEQEMLNDLNKIFNMEYDYGR